MGQELIIMGPYQLFQKTEDGDGRGREGGQEAVVVVEKYYHGHLKSGQIITLEQLDEWEGDYRQVLHFTKHGGPVGKSRADLQ